MLNNSALLIVPNTKEGLASIKYLSSKIVEHNIFIKLVSKKEFDLYVDKLNEDFTPPISSTGQVRG